MTMDYSVDDAAEAECVRALHAAGSAGREVKLLEARIAATRIMLILTLTGRFGWSNRGVAAELDITEQMVSKLLRRNRKKEEQVSSLWPNGKYKVVYHPGAAGCAPC